jgi:hypothetical protein
MWFGCCHRRGVRQPAHLLLLLLLPQYQSYGMAMGDMQQAAGLMAAAAAAAGGHFTGLEGLEGMVNPDGELRAIQCLRLCV